MRIEWRTRLGQYDCARSDMHRRALGWALNLIVIACLIAPMAVMGQGQTQVRTDPPLAQVRSGETVTVHIVVADVQDLYGLDVRLAFDPAQVEVLDADSEKEGVQIQPGAFLYPDFMVRNQADNQAGTIWFAINQINPHEAVSGTGAVASITFRGKAAGTSSLSFTYHLLGTRQGEAIEAVTQDGQISVERTSAAPTLPPAETDVPATETPVPSVPTETPYPTETMRPTQAPTRTAVASQPTSTPVPPSTEPTAVVTAAEPVATPTTKVEQATAEPTAVPQQVTPVDTPTSEPTEALQPGPTPTTARRQAAVVTPTAEPQSGSGSTSSSLLLYGFVFVAAVGLLIWMRRSGVAG